jgi:hypothetical protein
MKLEFYDKGPIGCLVFGNNTGKTLYCVNLLSIDCNIYMLISVWLGEIFWVLTYFHGDVKSTVDNPVLLTMDNHATHLFCPAFKFAKEKWIILLTFPPHCSSAFFFFHNIDSVNWSEASPRKCFASIQLRTLFGVHGLIKSPLSDPWSIRWLEQKLRVSCPTLRRTSGGATESAIGNRQP